MALSIRFRGNYYVLYGNIEHGGPIATPEARARFGASFAHLYPTGKIMRYHSQIGTAADIKILGEHDDTPITSLDGFNDPAWYGPEEQA